MQLSVIKKEVRTIYPTMKPSSKEYKASVTMLSAAAIGTDVTALVEYTGYSKAFITMIVKNLTNARIFSGNRVHADWFSKNGAIAFYGDVNLALGNVKITASKLPARFNSLSRH